MNAHRSLDEWYFRINSIYLDRNFYRDSPSIFAHLVEIMGGLSLLASNKTKPNVNADLFVAKAIAWWFALCGKVGVRSVQDMLWAKFPSVCPYCLACPHNEDRCRSQGTPQILDWSALSRLGKENARNKPSSLGAWQRIVRSSLPGWADGRLWADVRQVYGGTRRTR